MKARNPAQKMSSAQLSSVSNEEAYRGYSHESIGGYRTD